MKKLFISQPMRGKTPEEITAERERMIAYAGEVVSDEIEVLDTYYKDFNGSRVEFLGRSIGDLGKADIAIFAPGWENFDGCCCEHIVCETYGIPHIHGLPPTMTQEREAAILEAAIAKHGTVPQVIVAIEEQAELIKAICKFLRHTLCNQYEEASVLASLSEERADVSIMLNQLDLIFGDNVEMEITKLERLEKQVVPGVVSL